MTLVTLIRDFDRRMMETLDGFILAVWNNLEIKWITQQRILTLLSVVFSIIPEFVKTHRLSDDALWIIGLAIFWQSMVTHRSRDVEAHNTRISLMRFTYPWFGYRMFMWAAFSWATYATVFSKEVGAWLDELGLILWYLAVFCLDTYIPTDPPKRRRKEELRPLPTRA